MNCAIAMNSGPARLWTLRMMPERTARWTMGVLAAVLTMCGWRTMAAAALETPLLVNFENPIPQSDAEFGNVLAPVGSDKVVIGAWKAFGGDGAAYLFRTDGTLICAMTNPSPPSTSILQFGSVNFGMAVAGLGADRIIIGAPYQSVKASSDGAAFLFAADGTILNTFTNPAPVSQSQFGRCVAAVPRQLGASGQRKPEARTG